MKKLSLKDLGVVEAPEPILPPGNYTGELRAIEPGRTARGNTLKFRFEVVDNPDYLAITIIGFAAANLCIGSKACEWVEALNGGEQLEPGQPVDWDSLVGRRAKILVEHNKSRREPAMTFANVVAVYPPDTPDL